MRNNFKRFLGVALVLIMAFAVMTVSAFATEETNVAKIGGTEYATLAEAIKAATAGDTITLLTDVTENVTISKNLTIEGAGKTYTGNMSLTNKADITIKNVNFDGKGYNGYAVESKGAYYVTIEDCTAKNYGYGFVQVASGNERVTVKNITVSNVTYGIKVDYSDEVTLENVTVKDAYVGLCDSNYGEKTYTITDCKFNAEMPIVIWERTGMSNVTTLNFVGVNDFGTDDYLYSVVQAEGNTIKLGSSYCEVILPEVKEVAAIGTKKYATLADAITAAAKGDTITFLADVNENVTISKNITIDGADKKYTGTMTTKAGLSVTVQNVNFVNGGFDKPKANKSTTGSYTFNNCTFDGEGTYAYPLRFYGAGTVTVENCTVKDYKYSFLYVPSATLNVSVKNVTVENCPNYAVYFASGVTTATFENLTVKNSASGFVINNTANRTFTIENCKMENIETAVNCADGTNAVTCTVNGANDFGSAALSQYAVFKLNEGATLTAPEGLNVTTDVADHIVAYEDGVYSVVFKPVAMIGETGYAKLMDAVAAAKDGDVITVIDDHELENSDAEIVEEYGWYSYITVTDKAITIDLNGKKVTATPSFDDVMLSVVCVMGTGDVTLMDSSEAKTGAIDVTMAEGTKAYSLLMADGETSKLTIESGYYSIDKIEAGFSMIYASQTGTCYVRGGDFYLGNPYTIKKQDAMVPWMFNTWKNGANHIEVTGGTYNIDPQNRWNEVDFPAGYHRYQAADGKWTVANGPIILTQPTDVSVRNGEIATTSVVAIGDGLTY